jgi:hypothetical protein
LWLQSSYSSLCASSACRLHETSQVKSEPVDDRGQQSKRLFRNLLYGYAEIDLSDSDDDPDYDIFKSEKKRKTSDDRVKSESE